MKNKKRTKRIVAAAVAAALLAGGVGAVALTRGKAGGAVKVIPLEEIAQTDLWMDRAQYEGEVRAENLQSVYLSSTQQLKEICVREGDEVKKGDPLLYFDTTLSELELERQRIAVRKQEVRLSDAKATLSRLNGMKPYTPPEPAPEPEPEIPEPEVLPLLLGGDGTAETPYEILWNDACRCDAAFVDGLLPPAAQPETLPDGTPAPDAPAPAVWAAFRTRAYDSPRGELLRSWGVIFTREPDGGFSLAFFEPEPPEEAEPEPEPVSEAPEEETPTYTAAELARMRDEARAQIRDTETSLKTERLKLKRLELELQDGVVKATLDGVVRSVARQEDGGADGPVVTVSAGGAWRIAANVGELDLDQIAVGDAVRVESWMDGGAYDGVVTAISHDPASSGWYGGAGNPNVSLYPVTVEVPADAQLQNGDYVSVSFGGGGQQSGLYLESMFIRRENGRSFVFAADENGRLEKREVRTGRVFWGSTVEILDGLTAADAVAFPYGKNVKPGAKTELSDASALYENMYY